MNATIRWSACVLAGLLCCAAAGAAEPTQPAKAAKAAKPAPAPARKPAVPAPATAVPAAPAASAVPSASTRASLPFARVGDTVISGADFQRALAVAMRKKYYHAKPPEAEYAQFQRQVGDDVVNRVLLLAEARRRGVGPDRDQIKATVEGYDAQYKASPNWAANRDKMLAAVVPQLEQESTFERFERQIKQVGEPDEATARAYYDKNLQLFVEPEQVKLRVIVLRVDPSSTQAVWNSAKAEIHRIHSRLQAGAAFDELAKLHSNDRSAPRGGEMDYTHRGMLPEAVHGVVDQLAVGATAEPVQLLEGWAILKLEGRRPAQQRSFEQVRARAGDLWQRAEGQARWAELIARLRQGTRIQIDESHYAPLRGPSEKPRAG
jgi:parvulin-like peptidyl-prolyl isomerase